MIVTEISYPSGKTGIRLEPDISYKYITNGEEFFKLLILGKSDSVENWHDTNEEPPEPEPPEEEESEENG